MTIICVKSSRGIDLLGAQITINDQDMEVCGLARQEYKDGLLWQWWLLLPAE